MSKPKIRKLVKKPNCTQISNSCGYACISKGENCEAEAPSKVQPQLDKKAEELAKPKPKPKPKPKAAEPPKSKEEIAKERAELLRVDYEERLKEGKYSRSPFKGNLSLKAEGSKPVSVTKQVGVDEEGKPITETVKFRTDRPGLATIWHRGGGKELPEANMTFKYRGEDQYGTPFVTLQDIVFELDGKKVREEHVNVYLNTPEDRAIFDGMKPYQKFNASSGFLIENYRRNPAVFDEKTELRYGLKMSPSEVEITVIDDYSEGNCDIIELNEPRESTMSEQRFWSVFNNGNTPKAKMLDLADRLYKALSSEGRSWELSDEFMLLYDSLSSPSNPL